MRVRPPAYLSRTRLDCNRTFMGDNCFRSHPQPYVTELKDVRFSLKPTKRIADMCTLVVRCIVKFVVNAKLLDTFVIHPVITRRMSTSSYFTILRRDRKKLTSEGREETYVDSIVICIDIVTEPDCVRFGSKKYTFYETEGDVIGRFLAYVFQKRKLFKCVTVIAHNARTYG